jgi:NADH-quinone oxidoreductase subunit M
MHSLIAQLSELPAAEPVSGGNALLPLLIVLPVLGAIVVATLRKNDALARTVALGVGFAMFLLSALVLSGVLSVTPAAGYQNVFVSSYKLNALSLGVSPQFAFHLGVDAISAWMLALTGVLVPIAIWASFSFVKERSSSYYAWMLALAAAINGAFMARDALLFYTFFEVTLVPCFFIMNGWGGPDRKRAATKFFIYTFLGSVFMLTSLLYTGFKFGTFEVVEMARLAQVDFTPGEQFWVLAGLLAGFCVKVPLIPLHTWLPDTYREAPSPLTALLSGLLAKLGVYGLIRLAIPVGYLSNGQGTEAIVAHPTLLMWMSVLAVIAIVYAGLVAWVQNDAKMLVAYSSVSHLGFCVLALTAMSTMGIQTAVLYMVNHGISTAAIFLMIGFIETRFGSRRFDVLSGLGRGRPKLSFFMVLFVMSSIGLPLTNGFQSEFLSILSTLSAKHLGLGFAIVAGMGIVLGAVYMLHFLGKLIFGPERVPNEGGDLTGREVLTVLPLAVIVIVLGIRPGPILDSVRPTANAIRQPMEKPKTAEAVESTPLTMSTVPPTADR